MLFVYSTQNEIEPMFSIDHTEMFQIKRNMYTWVYIRAGKHVLASKWSNGLWSNKNDHPITIEAGTNYYERMMFNEDWNPYWLTVHAGFRKVTEQAAKKDTATCWFCKTLVNQIDNISLKP